MACALRLFLIYFCLRLKIISTLSYKILLLSIRIVNHDSESLSYLGTKIWSSIPTELNQESSLKNFKASIKLWKPFHSPCRLCKTSINGLGFLQVSNECPKMCLSLIFCYIDVISSLGLVRKNIRYLV